MGVGEDARDKQLAALAKSMHTPSTDDYKLNINTTHIKKKSEQHDEEDDDEDQFDENDKIHQSIEYEDEIDNNTNANSNMIEDEMGDI